MRRVTQVLAEIIREFPDTRGSPEERLYWLDRGAAVHRATELYDRDNLDYFSVDPAIETRLAAWIKFRKEIGGDLLAIEAEVVHPKLRYVGHLDRVLRGCRMFPSDDVLLDIKSGKAPKQCALQTMAYKLAWKGSGRRKIHRMSVELTDEGTYRTGGDMVYKEDAMDEVGWMGCLWAFEWKQRNGLI